MPIDRSRTTLTNSALASNNVRSSTFYVPVAHLASVHLQNITQALVQARRAQLRYRSSDTTSNFIGLATVLDPTSWEIWGIMQPATSWSSTAIMLAVGLANNGVLADSSCGIFRYGRIICLVYTEEAKDDLFMMLHGYRRQEYMKVGADFRSGLFDSSQRIFYIDPVNLHESLQSL